MQAIYAAYNGWHLMSVTQVGERKNTEGEVVGSYGYYASAVQDGYGFAIKLDPEHGWADDGEAANRGLEAIRSEVDGDGDNLAHL